jgi:hypothetical protein
MSIIIDKEFDFLTIEREVWLYITRNNNKMCKYSDIYNNIVTERNIKNPKILNDLKLKLLLIIRQFDSRYDDVYVVKDNDYYNIGYNITKIDDNDLYNYEAIDINSNIKINNNSFETINSNIKINDTDLELSKQLFDYVIDNTITYPLTKDCNGETLLFIGIKLNDPDRIKKILDKYSMSFFSKNKDGDTALDLIPVTLQGIYLYKYAIQENNTEIQYLKKEIQKLNNKRIETNNDIQILHNKLNTLMYVLLIVSILHITYYFL